MSISDRTSTRKQPVSWPKLGEMTWLGMIALALVMLHILAGSLLQPAGTQNTAAPLEDARASSMD